MERRSSPAFLQKPFTLPPGGRIVKAGPQHEAFRQDVIAVLDKHAGALPAHEMLALAAHLVGQLVAMQDQRKMTSAQAMEIVAQNITRGNQEVFDELMKPQGGG